MSKITLVLVLMYSILPGCMSRHPTAGHDADFITFNYGEEFSDTDQTYGEGEGGEAKVRPAVRVRTSSPSVNALRAYEDNELVQQWIQYFSTSHKETFDTFLRRGSKYRLTIEAILRQHEVPEFLYYLAMIESGFSVTARSHAQAVGVWQFIEGTAKRYDLTVNRYVDERRDPIRATIAAAKYLRDLHNVFQSWFLELRRSAGNERYYENQYP
jgi:soluble lytic murein transglycosylase-like protein